MSTFAACLERVYFGGVGWALLGLNSEDYPGIEICDLKPEDVDVNKFHITSMLDEFYEYGINAQRDVYFEHMPGDDDAIFFLKGIENFPLLDEEAAYAPAPITLSQHVVKMLEARWLLDHGGGSIVDDEGTFIPSVLTLSDVALLANMDEKSVRNAANPKLKNHLKTFNCGARTYVRVDDAKKWLQGRRGFKPTVMVDKHAERDLTKTGFFSKEDFGSYLTLLREQKSLSLTDVANSIQGVTEEKLRGLEQGEFIFDQDLFVALAQLYQLDPKAFVLAALALHQWFERERIEEQINTQIQD